MCISNRILWEATEKSSKCEFFHFYVGVSKRTDMKFVGVSKHSNLKLAGVKKQSDIKLMGQQNSTLIKVSINSAFTMF